MIITDVKSKVPKHPTKEITYRNINNITHVVVHHGLTKRGLAGSNYLSYLSYHINNLKWNCGGYTFGINDNGEILQGYDLNVRTNHVGNFNTTHLGIVLAGDFRHEDPTDKQYQALIWLLKEHLPKVLPKPFQIVGHNQVKGYHWKDCPMIDMDKVRNDVKESVTMSNNTPSNWAKLAWEKAIKAGVTDGTNPQGQITREQVVVMMDRLGLLK